VDTDERSMTGAHCEPRTCAGGDVRPPVAHDRHLLAVLVAHVVHAEGALRDVHSLQYIHTMRRQPLGLATSVGCRAAGGAVCWCSLCRRVPQSPSWCPCTCQTLAMSPASAAAAATTQTARTSCAPERAAARGRRLAKSFPRAASMHGHEQSWL